MLLVGATEHGIALLQGYDREEAAAEGLLGDDEAVAAVLPAARPPAPVTAEGRTFMDAAARAHHPLAGHDVAEVGAALDADADVPDEDDVPDVVADTAVPLVADVWLGVFATVAAATVVVPAGCARCIVASVAPNSSAAVASRVAAVRRPERPGRTRRLGTRALRMEIAPEWSLDVTPVCDRSVCPR